MAKKGDKHIDAQGQEWRFTEGGNWRLYKNGKQTDTISKGSTPPGGTAPAAGAATPTTTAGAPNSASSLTTVTNTTPQNRSPDGDAYLYKAKNDLQQQVAAGAITQQMADTEYARREKEINSYSPALQAEAWKNLQKVSLGQLDLPTADRMTYEATQKENQTSPNIDTNITAGSPSQDVIDQTFDVGKAGGIQETVLTNPNQQGPFGSRNVTIDPVTGQPTITDTLSQGNQQVLSGIQGSSNAANFNLNELLGQNGQFGQFLQGAGPQSGYSDPALEGAVYNRLTQGYDREKGQAQEQLAQTLSNRGIPVNSEAYRLEMERFDEGWNNRFDTARQEATIQGTNAALVRQQNNIGSLNSLVGGLGTLGTIGQGGLYQPNFQGFNSASVTQPDTQAIFDSLLTAQLQREGIASAEKQQQLQLQQQKDLAKGLGGGGGGGGESPSLKNPFGGAPPGS